MSRADDVARAIRADPGSALVALDFDGTLAPIVARPQDSRLVLGAVEVLTALAGQVGAVALVSGRPAADLVAIVGQPAASRLHVLGHYGLQSWYAGELSSPDPDPGVAVVRQALPAALAGAPAGVTVEDKTHSLVVHTRGSQDPVATLAWLTPALAELAASHGLELVPGRLVLELRPPGTDKGVALRSLVATTGASLVVYAGDDLGDLPAYRTLTELRAQGRLRAALIASSPTADPAPAELLAGADLVLDGPAAVLGWLRGLLI